MDLKDIATISGKSGLYRILKPTRSGVILETVDEQKSRIVAGASNRVSILKEISIYTTDQTGSVPLEDVFMNIFDTYGNALPLDSKSSNDELKSFIEKVVPEYDSERVYVSDIKKIVAWYGILINYLPEQFEAAPASDEKEEVNNEEAPAEGITKAATEKPAKAKKDK
jgi:hypothetical protein